MTDNTRTQVKATIRRAMKAAERATNELDATAMNELGLLYQSVLSEIQFLVMNAADELGEVRLSQLQTLTREIETLLDQLAQTQASMVDGYIVQAAQHGGTTFSTTVAAATVSQSIDEAVLSVRTMTHKDGLQLSDRLWRVDRYAREVITQAVERAVIMGQSASEAAQAFRQRSQPVPADIAHNAGLSNAAGISRTVAQELMVNDGAPYSQIKRVMRTEINRAHGMAFQNAAFEDEFVVGTQFKLSPNHPKPDICDMHARANLFGLGKGVYPKGKSPWPAHPNTLSYEQVVFVDEVTEEDRTSQTDRISWLKGQSREGQKAVLGHDKKVAALQQGHLKENMIATPWKHLEPLLKRKGIDTETL
ncbi:hypothetical protein [Photobacterium salinisoli]|uniref:hypothetical protein n=1 Tax=Photobacterium salinisoli TaxID=1616783 RepID=UPI000EA2D3CE|nr:hypothetical protein [Photobacterium salinisoli]